MFAKIINLDDERDEARLEYVPLKHLKQVWSALDLMDGDRFSDLIVAEGPPSPEYAGYPFSGKAMAIGGGANNQFFCEAYMEKGENPWRLLNPNAPDTDEYVLIKRGQETDHWLRNVVGKKQVREALKAFVERGELCKTLSWEEPGPL